MNRKITYTRRIVIKDKPLYRTIAEWTLIGGLLGGLIVGAYYKQKEFRESVIEKAKVSYSTNEVSNISGNKLERVLE